MLLRVLGPVELQDPDGRPVPLGGPRQTVLLAVLASAANRPLSAGRLVDLLWPEDPPVNPIAALHNGVSRLRKALAGTGIALQSRASSYQLRVPRDRLDALVFEDLARAAAAGDPDSLAAALRLWQGEPYLGLHHISPLRHEAARLTELRLSTVEDAAVRLSAAGAHAASIRDLRGAVAEAPLRERSRILLMRALAASGRTPEALDEYRDYRATLVDETGLDPSPAVRAAHRALLSDAPAEPDDESLPAALALTAVPEPLSPLVGREREVAEVADLVARGHRLVTLTGPGGIGKTRLALHLACRAWPGPAAFVDLAPVTSADDVADAFARALGIRLAAADPVDDLSAAVSGRALLLLVDNFEHVLPAAGLLAALLARCAGLHALVTSRERLDVPHQTEYVVGALAVPPPDAGVDDVLASPAVTLFLDRLTDRSVARSPAATVGIGRLCREVGGLPLAVELAAGLVRFRSVADVLEDAVGSLVGDPSGALASAIRWSYDRLPAADRAVLRGLSVFAGPFDEAAAQAVGSTRDTLDRLVSLGLLKLDRREPAVRYGVPRRLPELHGMLALVRTADGDHAGAVDSALCALTALDDEDSPALRTSTRVNAAQALTEADRGVLALEVLVGGLADLRETPDGMHNYQVNLGWAYLSTAEYAEALAAFRSVLGEVADAHEWPLVAELLAGSACALAHSGQHRAAALALGGAERLLQRLDQRLSKWIHQRLDDTYAVIARHPRGAEQVQAGRQLGVASIIDLIRETGVN